MGSTATEIKEQIKLDMEMRDLTEIEASNLIYCVGVDGLNHRCVSWEDKTLCGMRIKQKNQDTFDRYSCFHCTY